MIRGFINCLEGIDGLDFGVFILCFGIILFVIILIGKEWETLNKFEESLEKEE